MAQHARRSFFGTRNTESDDEEIIEYRSTNGKLPFLVQLPTLWKAMILTSFLLNLVLFAVVIFAAVFVFTYRTDLVSTTFGVQGFAKTNVTELRDVVQQLRAATIRTSIPLDQSLPLKGAGVVVPVDQITTVTLEEPVPLVLQGADIDLGAGNRLRAQNINLTLPQGTPLKIALKMDIPLDDVVIPIKLNVPVDIPLKETELGPQFERLGNIVDRLAYPAAPLLDMDIPQPPAVQQATAVPTTLPEQLAPDAPAPAEQPAPAP